MIVALPKNRNGSIQYCSNNFLFFWRFPCLKNKVSAPSSRLSGFIEVKQPNFHTKFLAPEALRGERPGSVCVSRGLQQNLWIIMVYIEKSWAENN